MSTAMLQVVALCAAFWTAVILFDRQAGEAKQTTRFILGLGLGAVSSHLGWALLHLPMVAGRPEAIWNLGSGLCVLFFPLGPLLLTPSSRAFAALPLALVVARVGCLAAGCCHGPAGEPMPMYEIAGLLALQVLIRRLPGQWGVGAFLAGFGLIRLLAEPWRAMPPLGAPLVAPAWIAGFWVLAGVAFCVWRRPGAADWGRGPAPVGDTVGEEFMDGITNGVQQDLPIWGNKIHRANPTFCEADGMLADFRRWAKQFYS